MKNIFLLWLLVFSALCRAALITPDVHSLSTYPHSRAERTYHTNLLRSLNCFAPYQACCKDGILTVTSKDIQKMDTIQTLLRENSTTIKDISQRKLPFYNFTKSDLESLITFLNQPPEKQEILKTLSLASLLNLAVAAEGLEIPRDKCLMITDECITRTLDTQHINNIIERTKRNFFDIPRGNIKMKISIKELKSNKHIKLKIKRTHLATLSNLDIFLKNYTQKNPDFFKFQEVDSFTVSNSMLTNVDFSALKKLFPNIKKMIFEHNFFTSLDWKDIEFIASHKLNVSLQNNHIKTITGNPTGILRTLIFQELPKTACLNLQKNNLSAQEIKKLIDNTNPTLYYALLEKWYTTFILENKEQYLLLMPFFSYGLQKIIK